MFETWSNAHDSSAYVHSVAKPQPWLTPVMYGVKAMKRIKIKLFLQSLLPSPC